jgi:hypothetical protein
MERDAQVDPIPSACLYHRSFAVREWKLDLNASKSNALPSLRISLRLPLEASYRPPERR